MGLTLGLGGRCSRWEFLAHALNSMFSPASRVRSFMDVYFNVLLSFDLIESHCDL